MWRFLVLAAVSAPFLWTAYAEWETVGASPADSAAEAQRLAAEGEQMAGEAKRMADEAGQKAGEAKQQADEAHKGYRAWADHALRDGGGEPAAGWETLQKGSKERAELVVAARAFAQRYWGNDPDSAAGVEDPLFQRALLAREAELGLFELRKKSPKGLINFKKKLDDYKSQYGGRPEFNKQAVALLEAWWVGQDLLDQYPTEKWLTLLRQVVMHTAEQPQDKPFDDAELEMLRRAANDLSAIQSAPGVTTDVSIKADWWNGYERFAKAAHGRESHSLERIEDLAVGIRYLRKAGKMTDKEARNAVAKLCEHILSKPPPTTDMTLFNAKRNELLDTREWSKKGHFKNLAHTCDRVGVIMVRDVCEQLDKQGEKAASEKEALFGE